jgi:hypothetical protein
LLLVVVEVAMVNGSGGASGSSSVGMPAMCTTIIQSMARPRRHGLPIGIGVQR